MANNATFDDTPHNGGAVSMVFGAVASVAFGALIGGLLMALRPVATVAEPPAEPEAGVRYFLEGGRVAEKAGEWMRQRDILVAGPAADVMLNEHELNLWFATAIPPKPKGEEAVMSIWEPQSVNFRVREGAVQVAARGTLTLFGLSTDIVAQARGSFMAGDVGLDYVPDEFYIGALPVHRFEPLKQWLFGLVARGQPVPPEAPEIWARVSLLSVEGEDIRLAVR